MNCSFWTGVEMACAQRTFCSPSSPSYIRALIKFKFIVIGALINYSFGCNACVYYTKSAASAMSSCCCMRAFALGASEAFRRCGEFIK